MAKAVVAAVTLLGALGLWLSAAFHHGCVQANDRPPGWLGATFDVYLFPAGSGNLVLCYQGTWAYNASWASSFAVGAVVCGGRGPGDYLTVAHARHQYNGTYRNGAVQSPTHTL